MKTALSLAFGLTSFALSAFAQVSPISVPTTPTIDKVKVESYLRRLEAWPPIITVKIDDPKAAPDIPGFYSLAVHLTYNEQHLDQSYFVSRDGLKIFKGEVHDLNKSPFQANLDKIKTDKQPTFGP